MTASVEQVATILARVLMDQHGLQDWELEWADEDWKGASGRCFWDQKIIVLSRKHLLDTAAHNILECIRHEIAHALVGPDTKNDHHGIVWWNKLLEIGGRGLWVTNNGRVTDHRPKGGKKRWKA